MYKYSDSTGVSLHDNRATEISVSGNIVSFIFKDGFTVLADNPHNTFEMSAYTGSSEVRFRLSGKNIGQNITVYIFSKTEKENVMLREEIPFFMLADRINKGSSKLEFITSYKSYDGFDSYVFICCLWSNGEPYDRECEVIISADEVEYLWNEMFTEE